MHNLQHLLNQPSPNSCQFSSFACLQQPQTLSYLKYLRLAPSSEHGACLLFNSDGVEGSEGTKKDKRFEFDGVYDRSEKMKFVFGEVVEDVVKRALQGQNQTLFLYGTDEKSKDKIMLGESQNSGILLCMLAEVFALCHKRALEDFVTIKLGCSLFRKAKFMDIFQGSQNSEVQFVQDPLEGGLLHATPEIIIRNVKTGLKLLNIITKQLADQREEDSTQNLIITLKLELDCKKVQEQTEVFCLSRINFIKLANPSVNSSLKGVNKNNVWHVNLLNLVQNQQGAEETKDDFTTFLKETIFRDSHKIYAIVSISNKMTSNECLTGLLFATQMKSLQTPTRKYFIDVPKLNGQRSRLLSSLLPEVQKSLKLVELWIEYIGYLESYMSEFNYLEYEYSLVIGEACEKLNKYLFTEEIEEFFYAKKVGLEVGEDLPESYNTLRSIYKNIGNLQKKIMAQMSTLIDRKTMQRVFSLDVSLAHHFLIQGLEENLIVLQQYKKKLEEQKIIQMNTTKINTAAIIAKIEAKKQQNSTIHEDNKGNSPKPPSKMNTTHSNSLMPKVKLVKKPVGSASIDNLEGMFKNKNVGLANKKIKGSIDC